jgi:hypothetical protein
MLQVHAYAALDKVATVDDRHPTINHEPVVAPDVHSPTVTNVTKIWSNN